MDGFKKMKVAITIPALNKMGGVASYYKSVLPYLNKNNSLNVVCFHLGSKLESFSLLHPITDQIQFDKFLKKEKPDLVHINPSLGFKSFIRDGLLIWQAKRKNIPVLVFFHGWELSFESMVEKKLKWFFNKTYLKADKFIVLASDFKHKLQKWGVKSDIALGTTAVDNTLLEKFDINDKIQALDKKDEFNILFLSRIEKEKGVFETIDAFEILLNKKYNVRLSIAGDGSALNAAFEYVKKNKLPENRLIFLGYVSGEGKIKAFKEHDIYCFPTTFGEGMPTSVLEAMAFGLPVVTRPVGGLKDFFEDKKMGYISENKDSDHIAGSIEKLICDRELMITISKCNFFYAQDRFLASNVAENLIEIYSNILK